MGGSKTRVCFVVDNVGSRGEVPEDVPRFIAGVVVDDDYGRGGLMRFEEMSEAVANEWSAVVGDDGDGVEGGNGNTEIPNTE